MGGGPTTRPVGESRAGHGFRGASALVAEPLLPHEDPESVLLVRDGAASLLFEITRPGLKMPYRVTVLKADVRVFATDVLEAVDSTKRFADVPGPAEGKMSLHAMIAPEEDHELLMLMVVRGGGKTDDMETEFGDFASRDQLGRFLEDLVRGAGGEV